MPRQELLQTLPEELEAAVAPQEPLDRAILQVRFPRVFQKLQDAAALVIPLNDT